MKALSIWEPEASLFYCGARLIETRSWRINYRGPLLLCAALGGRSRNEVRHLLSLWHIQKGLAPLVGKPFDLEAPGWAGVEEKHLQFGKALAVVDLVACQRTDDLTLGEIRKEMIFGDFGPKRFAWKFANLRPFKEPFPVWGKQGLFEVDDERLEGREILRRAA